MIEEMRLRMYKRVAVADRALKVLDNGNLRVEGKLSTDTFIIINLVLRNVGQQRRHCGC
jgi:hypothetical protein